MRSSSSQDIMKDPVRLSTGNVYDRDQILQWFQSGHSTDPLSNVKVNKSDLAPLPDLKAEIEALLQANPRYASESGA